MMNDIEILDDETIEDLQLNGLCLIQKKDAFRFCMDSVLLADFANIHENDIVADLGCGNGIIPLLLYGRNKGRLFYAVDLMKESVELAEKNARLNGIEKQMIIIHSDAEEVDKHVQRCSVDAVVCNPPYGHYAASMLSPNAQKSKARNQEQDTLSRFFKGAFQILKGKGKLFMIYPAQQMLYVMQQLQRNHLEPKRFQMIYPFKDKPANLVLIEAVKDAKPTLHPLPPLIIYNRDGSLTNELKSVYHIQEQTGF